MKKLRTIEDILNDRTLFTEEQANRIRANVDKEVAKIKASRKLTNEFDMLKNMD